VNTRGGWALIQSTWASWLQYRSFFFILAFGWMIPPLVYLFVWSTAAGESTIGGLSRGEFVAYYLVLMLVNQLTYSQANWTVGDVIRDGSFNSWLLRPLSPLYHPLASDIAGKVVTLAFVIPAAGLLALFLRPELHAGPEQIAAFLLALGMAWLLRFFWGYGLALLAFWAARFDALLAVQDTLVFLLAGVVAPVPLLPGFLRGAATLLPFRYMVGFPVEALTGQVEGTSLLAGLALQAAWLAVALGFSAAAWRLGVRRYTAVGG
jgi:ABC-2 type transport system permease protein